MEHRRAARKAALMREVQMLASMPSTTFSQCPSLTPFGASQAPYIRRNCIASQHHVPSSFPLSTDGDSAAILRRAASDYASKVQRLQRPVLSSVQPPWGIEKMNPESKPIDMKRHRKTSRDDIDTWDNAKKPRGVDPTATFLEDTVAELSTPDILAMVRHASTMVAPPPELHLFPATHSSGSSPRMSPPCSNSSPGYIGTPTSSNAGNPSPTPDSPHPGKTSVPGLSESPAISKFNGNGSVLADGEDDPLLQHARSTANPGIEKKLFLRRPCSLLCLDALALLSSNGK